MKRFMILLIALFAFVAIGMSPAFACDSCGIDTGMKAIDAERPNGDGTQMMVVCLGEDSATAMYAMETKKPESLTDKGGAINVDKSAICASGVRGLCRYS